MFEVILVVLLVLMLAIWFVMAVAVFQLYMLTKVEALTDKEAEEIRERFRTNWGSKVAAHEAVIIGEAPELPKGTHLDDFPGLAREGLAGVLPVAAWDIGRYTERQHIHYRDDRFGTCAVCGHTEKHVIQNDSQYFAANAVWKTRLDVLT